MSTSDARAGHSLGRNLISSLLGSLGVRLPSVAVLIFLARAGSKHDVGIYVLALSYTALFNLLFSETSVCMFAVKEVSRDRGLAPMYLAAMPVANFLIGAAMMLLCLGIGALLYGSERLVFEVVAILSVSTFLQGLTGGHRWYFKAVRRFDYDSALSWVLGVAMLTFGAPLFLLTHDVRWYSAGIAAGSLVGLIFAVLAVAHLAGQPVRLPVLRGAAVRRLLLQAAPYAAATVVVTATWNIDTVLLGHWRSLAEVGVYGATMRIVLALRSIAAIILTVLFPFLAYQHQNEPENFERTFGTALIVLAWVGGGIACILALGSGGLLRPLYGTRYLAGAPILAIAGWAVCLSFLASVLGITLIAQHRIHANLCASVLGLVVQVVGCWYLIPRLGGVGSALAGVVTEGLIACFMIFQLWRFLIQSIRRWIGPMLKIVAVGAATLGIGFATRFLPAEIRLVLAFILFTGLSWIARVLTPSELRELRATLRTSGAPVAVS